MLCNDWRFMNWLRGFIHTVWGFYILTEDFTYQLRILLSDWRYCTDWLRILNIHLTKEFYTLTEDFTYWLRILRTDWGFYVLTEDFTYWLKILHTDWEFQILTEDFTYWLRIHVLEEHARADRIRDFSEATVVFL